VQLEIVFRSECFVAVVALLFRLVVFVDKGRVGREILLGEVLLADGTFDSIVISDSDWIPVVVVNA
jgi:hypothetical protein